MRRLFVQIFVWFSLALTLLLLLSFTVNSIWRTASPIRLLDRGPSNFYAALGVEAYERGGRAELRTTLARIEQLTGAQAFIVDTQGRSLSGRAVPGEVAEATRSVLREGFGERRFHGSSRLFARPTHGKDGTRYVYVSVAPPQRGLLRVVLPRHAEWVLLALAILVGALVCYLLARHLSAPIGQLRLATHRLAEGDLSARVDPALRGRYTEISELAHDFDRMAERVESLVGAQRELLQNVSHELRSPLARLRLALELARQRGGVPPAAAGAKASSLGPALDRIESETERLDQLIGELLTLSRLESGTQALAPEPIDLAAMLAEIAADARFEDSERPIDLEIDQRCEGSRAPLVAGSPTLLRSAIENVVRNALRYAPPGQPVRLTLKDADDGSLRIRVRDQGPGVPDDELAQIFSPFVRTRAARARDGGGLGLGLAVAKRAIEAHGGTIGAQNASGGGLLVELSLPSSLVSGQS